MNPTWPAAMILLLVACSEDGGGNDTILTGFSGVLIFGIVAYVIYRYVKKSGGKT